MGYTQTHPRMVTRRCLVHIVFSHCSLGNWFGTCYMWSTLRDLRGVVRSFLSGLSIRSVCWAANTLLVGTQNGEVFQVPVRNVANAVALTQGHYGGELWGLAVHPRKNVAATASDDCSVRLVRV